MDDSIDSSHQNPHNLQQDLSGFSNEDWRNGSFEFSPHLSHSHLDNSQNSSFRNELPIYSKIAEPMLELHQVLQEVDPSIDQKAPELEVGSVLK